MKRVLFNKLVPMIVVLAVALFGGTFLSETAAEPYYPDEPENTVQAASANLLSSGNSPTLDVPAPETEHESEREPEYFTINMIGDCTLASGSSESVRQHSRFAKVKSSS